MAQVTMKRRLVNPARRTAAKKTTTARKRLTLAQRLAGFGGKRSQSAAKAAQKRKRTAAKPAAKRTSSARSAPAARKKAAAKRPARKANPPARIITYALENPAPPRGGQSVAQSKRKSTTRRRANPTAATRRKSAPRRTTRRKSNPAPAARRRRRSNPAGGGIGKMISQSGYLLAGAVGARSATQLVLGSKNVGVLGYAANLVSGFVLGGIAGKVLKSKPAGQVVIQGAVLGTLLRAVQELSPLGSAVNQSLGVSGLRGDIGMGFISPAAFRYFPQPVDESGAPAALPAATAPAAAASSNGVGMLGRARSARF